MAGVADNPCPVQVNVVESIQDTTCAENVTPVAGASINGILTDSGRRTLPPHERTFTHTAFDGMFARLSANAM